MFVDQERGEKREEEELTPCLSSVELISLETNCTEAGLRMIA